VDGRRVIRLVLRFIILQEITSTINILAHFNQIHLYRLLLEMADSMVQH